jgi:hypothetical protein
MAWCWSPDSFTFGASSIVSLNDLQGEPEKALAENSDIFNLRFENSKLDERGHQHGENTSTSSL